MPLPRNPRPKHRPGQSRSSRRRKHAKRWLADKIIGRFVRYAELLEQKRQQDITNGTYRPPLENLGQEKAPGLATEGFSSFFREKEVSG
ncbi:hypothetical protein [Caulobacter sp. RL271]|uniref:Uncharacterized protein n=1 Tax=Caulobacter segnis TaxID=88688 RepID=A0ABY4ZZ13_9CAUL|nr:hypothetical protein [Caulobacter segnis]USQ97910.1 hypothetical protein MZV50_10370 [Caulobacter segnis]